MIVPAETYNKLENIVKAVRQSNQAKNNPDVFVRETLKRAKEGKLVEVITPEQVEAYAAFEFLRQFVPDKMRDRVSVKVGDKDEDRQRRANEITSVAHDRRKHKMMLKLLRYPEIEMRVLAAERFLIVFAMMDGYFDEASSLINQILLEPTEDALVKRSLLSGMVDNQGHSSRRGSPRGIIDTARQLINDIDQEIAYHALRILTALSDVRDWKIVLDRMVSLVGDDDPVAEYFLSAGVEYLRLIMVYEPSVVEWMKTLINTYPRKHLAMAALERIVTSEPELQTLFR